MVEDAIAWSAEFATSACWRRWVRCRARNLSSLEFEREAYADEPLPIGYGQTISQPFMVATMLEALELQPSDRVLEVGTGTGYQAALLGELAAEVWTIERHAELADKARQILQGLGYRNVHVVHGDGSVGSAAARAV